MKRFLIAIFLLLILLLNACSKEQKQVKSDVENINANKELSELSIFNLPSDWTNQHNVKMQLSDFRGKISVFVMIYTSCQSACPRLVADMRSIEKKIPKNLRDNINLVLVSIDPEVDTVERLKEFSIENEMDDDYWYFLRSSLENTRDFAMVLAVKYKKISPIDFSHSNIISLFDQEGLLVHQQEGLGVDNEVTVKKLIELAEKID